MFGSYDWRGPRVFILKIRLTLSVFIESRRNLRIYSGKRTMEFRAFMLLLGVCSPYWTTAAELCHKAYSLSFHDGILKRVMLTDLDLSGLNLTKIDEGTFNDFSNLTNLNLANNDLEDLPSRLFSKLINLETLSLANNKLNWIMLNFVGLTNLKRLDLSNNSIKSLSRSDLFGLTKSTEIIIEGNQLTEISPDVFGDPSTAELKVDKTWLRWNEEIDENIFTEAVEPDQFTVKICNTNDSLVEFVGELEQSEAFDNCSEVVINREKHELVLSKLELKTFQRGWYNVSSYTISGLDLSYNAITDITPQLLNDLPSDLLSVNLTGNNLREIRKNIIENIHLRVLSVAGCFISMIEDGALEKTHLTSLLAENNSLESLAFSRTLPKTIQQLVLRGNRITDIPVDALRSLKQLRTLDLSYNQLKRIEPGTFEDQGKLSTLILSNNQISELDSELFKGLKTVRRIYLDSNKIKRIASNTFLHLKSSVKLYLSLIYNEIDTIEKGSFADMNFSDLDLYSNRISEKSLPKGTFNSTAMRTLDLRKNLITKLNKDLFYGIWTRDLLLDDNKITTIERGTFKYSKIIGSLYLLRNPLEQLRNGALYGVQKKKKVKIFLGPNIKVIEGGAFESFRDNKNLSFSSELYTKE